jgi:acetylornithine deacetylase/succinyl-diaminopimelate desuccinylase-like protein
MARAGVPTAMLFVRSRGGVSHSPEEDSSEDDLRLAVRALAQLAAAAS